MRILILHSNIKTNSYADALLGLLIDFLKRSNCTIAEYNSTSELKEAEESLEKVAFILHTGKKQVSFFSRVTLNKILKKQKFTHLIQVGDSSVFKSGLPQLVVANNISHFIKSNHPPFIRFAVCSEADKQKAIEQNENIAKQIKVVPLTAADEYQPTDWSGQQAVKMQYTQGREYFLTSAADKTIQSFTDLLKAFSTFKKWQHSSMKLVVTGALAFAETEEWKEKLSTYKFREDLVWFDNTNQAQVIQLLAGAYAFIHAPVADNDVLPLLQAMKCETPCISFSTDDIKEYSGEAAMLVETHNYDQLAEKMILLYKDEALRNRLIVNGAMVSNQYTKERTFAALSAALPVPLH